MQFEYTSGNLIYRILNESSAASILEFYENNREDFERYEPVRPDNFYTIEYHRTLCRLEFEAAIRGKAYRFFLFEQNHPNKIIGCINFSNIQKGAIMSTNIGYKLDKSFRGHGYCRSAVYDLSYVMFRELSMHRIEAYIQPDNQPSIAVVENCGYRYDGTASSYALINGKWTDHLRYTLINVYQ